MLDTRRARAPEGTTAQPCAGTERPPRPATRWRLRTLAERDPSLLNRLASEARSRRRNHVAQRSEDVYPVGRQLTQTVVKLAPGWYFGTNISNRDKAKLLKAPCRAGGLTSGVDLVYSLPNAKA
jgi:hypothetical protein